MNTSNSTDETCTGANKADTAVSSYQFGTFNNVHPAAMYAVKLIGTMETCLEPLEIEMLDDAGLINEDGSVDFETAIKHVEAADRRMKERNGSNEISK